MFNEAFKIFCRNENVCVKWIIPVALAVDDYGYASELIEEEVIDDSDLQQLGKLFDIDLPQRMVDMGWESEEDMGYRERRECIATILAMDVPHDGIVAEVITPIRTYHQRTNPGTYSLNGSWGFGRLEQFYATSLESLEQKIRAWHKATVDKWMAEAPEETADA